MLRALVSLLLLFDCLIVCCHFAAVHFWSIVAVVEFGCGVAVAVVLCLFMCLFVFCIFHLFLVAFQCVCFYLALVFVLFYLIFLFDRFLRVAIVFAGGIFSCFSVVFSVFYLVFWCDVLSLFFLCGLFSASCVCVASLLSSEPYSLQMQNS